MRKQATSLSLTLHKLKVGFKDLVEKFNNNFTSFS